MRKRQVLFLAAVIIVALAVSLFPLESYITKPGHAYELNPLVEVEGGDEDDTGSLSLMTVTMMKATPALYAWASFADGYKIIEPEQIRNPHESEEEYNVRQIQLMSRSQINAISVAYEAAGASIEVKHEGVFVINILPDAAASGIPEPGDRILAIDGRPYESLEKFTDYLSSKEAGQSVIVQAERNGHTVEEEIVLAAIPGTEGRIGLGISFAEDLAVETDPEISLKSENIGGPSAGLMFSLEIYDQLVEEDVTKGYDIAGTGTLSMTGEVGRIGGIDQKIMAADQENIDIFFAPDNSFEGMESNYTVAAEVAEAIGSDMEIVPVRTFSDALDYLDALQPA